VHDRWSVLVLLILGLCELPFIRACDGQIRAEETLRGTPFASMPSSVPFFAAAAVVLPLSFIVLWLVAATVVEWFRERTLRAEP
jgi:hypothetical protein